MNRVPRIAIAVALIALCAGLGYWLSGGARRKPAPPAQPPATGAGEVVMREAESKHVEHGKVAWRVILDEVALETGGSAVKVQGLREGIIYDQTGQPALRVTAKQIRGDTTRKNFEVMGQVTVSSPKGLVITTERVKWINDEQRLTCPGQVTMRGKSIVVTTSQLDYNLREEKVHCPNRVRMYSGNNRLVGQSLKYDVKTGITDIIGGVQMVINPEEAKKILKELQ